MTSSVAYRMILIKHHGVVALHTVSRCFMRSSFESSVMRKAALFLNFLRCGGQLDEWVPAARDGGYSHDGFFVSCPSSCGTPGQEHQEKEIQLAKDLDGVHGKGGAILIEKVRFRCFQHPGSTVLANKSFSRVSVPYGYCRPVSHARTSSSCHRCRELRKEKNQETQVFGELFDFLISQDL
ncbi:hypothetical protein AUEXF2481DRAFT_44165 [Aureobasidium subglaciale EXF-2481]|uniref:Uncharacterized protein n=1 Tax=Aureobasidium subglaciale (strain EXF-2481) TaxID=1043005 RepID=A0A074Y5V4_AURSE|nr:uncharacterized protein AUEXF2481DRAFT_44165 [Aureobasidium subglaciale EXF-2481]KEQ91354.1 hypothetical protein AUEXF2481DRAFT_44165 [Aureobasidium subglaciale EXF-2481]